MNIEPRARVIVDNDFSGDPDDLFQLVHHLLSPSVRIPFVIGSHLSPDDPHDSSPHQAENAARVARRWLDLLGVAGAVPVYTGSNFALRNETQPIETEAARAIVREAMRDDTDLPLFLALGAGLTELASALMIEPRIAGRLTAVWIGGNEHPDVTVSPAAHPNLEYNLNIDPLAGQVVFNHSTVPLWQVPQNVYRQCSISMAELEGRIRPAGEVGRLLAEALDDAFEEGLRYGYNFGETYVLGDSPLVLLTALTTATVPDSVSSEYVEIPRPGLEINGTYSVGTAGGTIRVYRRLDTRLMFEDFYLKLAALAAAGR